MLLKETNLRLGLLQRLPDCFKDHGIPLNAEHDIHALVS